MGTNADIKNILSKWWGYGSFRPAQEEIIRSVLSGKDTIGLLPTGGGKSITFQVPAMAIDGLTVIITPLISLMKDQVDNLRNRGITAVYLHSGLSRREATLAIDRCRVGKARMLYLSPEKLQSQSFIDTLRLLNVKLIVIDEAHCISQWGYDFRPSYLKINDLRSLFPDAPALALTASATPEVIADISGNLGMKNPGIFRVSFSRDNISYIVRYCDYKEGKIIEILSKVPGCAIVYVRSRRRAREIAETLTKAGITAEFYHAGLQPQEKEERQNRWKNDETRVIVATNAFGMGIDKPDVRLVIHADLPTSLEEYYQEAGRAGRDNEPSFAILLCSRTDKGLLSRRLSESFPDKDTIKRVYELTGNFLDIAVGDGYNRLYEFNFNLFCTRFKLQPVTAHNSLALLTQAGYIDFSEEISTRSRVMILVTKDELYSIELPEETDRVLQFILRNYTGLFADYEYINEPLIASHLDLTEETVYNALLMLSRKHILHYVPRKTSPYILYTTSREEPRHIKIPRAIYEERRDKMAQRIDAMKRFAFDTGHCRVNTMLKYFGETPGEPCGKCDVCRQSIKKKPQQTAAIAESLLYLSSQPGGHTLDYILEQTGAAKTAVIDTLRDLMDKGRIVSDGDRFVIAPAK